MTTHPDATAAEVEDTRMIRLGQKLRCNYTSEESYDAATAAFIATRLNEELQDTNVWWDEAQSLLMSDRSLADGAWLNFLQKEDGRRYYWKLVEETAEFPDGKPSSPFAKGLDWIAHKLADSQDIDTFHALNRRTRDQWLAAIRGPPAAPARSNFKIVHHNRDRAFGNSTDHVPGRPPRHTHESTNLPNSSATDLKRTNSAQTTDAPPPKRGKQEEPTINEALAVLSARLCALEDKSLCTAATTVALPHRHQSQPAPPVSEVLTPQITTQLAMPQGGIPPTPQMAHATPPFIPDPWFHSFTGPVQPAFSPAVTNVGQNSWAARLQMLEQQVHDNEVAQRARYQYQVEQFLTEKHR
eukprot:TRINITY_DN48780_c0_g1_i1.p1 TRINITY_DN48780_c0_g1~~TRINITY_DN48780_c0_g1_i1.p1  ORF type:complete len:355 (-),score=1.59 TRINITY_DN48780_c0_g1_i1:436-1500(-)